MAITVQQFDIIAKVHGIREALAVAEEHGGVTGSRVSPESPIHDPVQYSSTPAPIPRPGPADVSPTYIPTPAVQEAPTEEVVVGGEEIEEFSPPASTAVSDKRADEILDAFVRDNGRNPYANDMETLLPGNNPASRTDAITRLLDRQDEAREAGTTSQEIFAADPVVNPPTYTGKSSELPGFSDLTSGIQGYVDETEKRVIENHKEATGKDISEDYLNRIMQNVIDTNTDLPYWGGGSPPPGRPDARSGEAMLDAGITNFIKENGRNPSTQELQNLFPQVSSNFISDALSRMTTIDPTVEGGEADLLPKEETEMASTAVYDPAGNRTMVQDNLLPEFLRTHPTHTLTPLSAGDIEQEGGFGTDVSAGETML